jgi:hypothetical protein
LRKFNAIKMNLLIKINNSCNNNKMKIYKMKKGKILIKYKNYYNILIYLVILKMNLVYKIKIKILN